jgi:hypothetical protein
MHLRFPPVGINRDDGGAPEHLARAVLEAKRPRSKSHVELGWGCVRPLYSIAETMTKPVDAAVPQASLVGLLRPSGNLLYP